MKIIKTNKGNEALVDDDSYSILSRYRWYENAQGYATTEIYVGKKQNTISMQRFIMNPPYGYEVDHINRNVLDNRLDNLRIVTSSQNNMNQKIRSDNKTGFKGVFKRKGSKSDKWFSYITVNHKYVYLGTFDNIDDAVAARKHAEEIYFGDFRRKELI